MTVSGPQCGELPVLRVMLPEDPIVYVDVGAGEYSECSNTWPFDQQGGHGLLVEPLREFWPQIESNRPRDILVKKAVLNFTGTCTMRIHGTVSSFREDWEIGDRELRDVPVEPLRSILDRHPDIRDACRLCSIDAEGEEGAVLQSIDLRVFHPDIFIVEYIKFSPDSVGEDLSGEWCAVLTENGYRECRRSWLNIIYLRNDLWKKWESVAESTPLPHSTVEQSKESYVA